MGTAAKAVLEEQQGDVQHSDALFGRTVNAIGWRFATECSRLVLQLTVSVILARLLPVDAFGLLALAMIVINLVLRVSEMGISYALVQRKEITDIHIRVSFSLSVLSGIILAAAIWSAAPFAATILRSEFVVPILRLISLSVFFMNVCATGWSLLQRNLDYRTLLVVEVASYGLGYALVSVVLALLGFGVWSLAWAAVVQSFLRAALVIWAAPHPMRPSFSRIEMGQLLNFGVGMSLSRIANFAAVSGDYFVVGRWLGPVALGLYSRAYQLMTLPIYQFSSIISEVLFPAYSIVQGDKERLRRAYVSSLSLSAIVVFPALTALCIAAPEIMSGVFGPEWKGATPPLQILCFGGFFLCMYNLGDSIARAKGAVYLKFGCHTVYALCVVGFSIIGSSWGITGVAVGVVAAVAVMYMLMGKLGNHLSELSWSGFFESQLPGVIIALAVAAVALPITVLARGMALPQLVILSCTLIVSFLAAITAGHLLPKNWLQRVSAGILTRISSHYSELRLGPRFRKSLSIYARKREWTFKSALVVYRLYENTLFSLHIIRHNLWRSALGLGRGPFSRTTQREIKWALPFPPFDTHENLIEWLLTRNIQVIEGGHTFYLPPQEGLNALIPSIVAFYPRGSGFKILKDSNDPVRARYLYEGRSLFLLMRLIGAPREQLIAANYMNSLGIGPRIWDLSCWEAQGKYWTVFVVEHLNGGNPTEEQYSAFLDRLHEVDSNSHLRVLIPNWQKVADFQPPYCNHNLICTGSEGLPQYIDFQNFGLTSLDAWTKETIAHANGEFQVDRSGRRTAKHELFGVAEREAAGWSFIKRTLQEAGLGFEGRIVLDLACNYGLMLRCSLVEGAGWGFGWDAPATIALAQELLLSIGTTRFSLNSNEVSPGHSLEDDVPTCLRHRLDEAIVFLSSETTASRLLSALANSRWRLLVYESDASPRARDEHDGLGAVLSDDVRILATADPGRKNKPPRSLTIFLRSKGATAARGAWQEA
jgi:teichuronic acid exporter